MRMCKLGLHWWSFVPAYSLWRCRDCGSACTLLDMAANRWSTPR